MNLWRVAMMTIGCLLLSGCLVVFKQPIAPVEAAPSQLLGRWQGQNEWGEQLLLDISRAADNRYSAHVRVAGQVDAGESYLFTVAHKGQRWYASIGLPKRFGEQYAIAGFELNKHGELVLFSLDTEVFLQLLQAGTMHGEVVQTLGGDSALISSPLSQVFAYLNDPANADVFIESARYQRVEQ